jgi:translocation and assembly module TamB
VIRRRLKILALSLLVFFGVIVAFLAWIIYTEAGLRFAVACLPEKLGPVTLIIEGAKGSIARGVSADVVDVQHERAHVRVEGGRATVNFWPILVGRIAANRAAADLVLVEVKPRLKPPVDPSNKFLPRLLSISAEHAESKSLVIVSPSGKRVEFTNVSGAGIVKSRIIRMFDGNITYGYLSGRAHGDLRAAEPYKLSGEVTARLNIEGQPEWRADASYDGDFDTLPIVGKLLTPFRADLAGALFALTDNFNWSARADVHNFDLRAFGGGGALGIISGPVQIGGEMAKFYGKGPLTVPGLGAGPFDALFEGYYEDQVVYATNYHVTHRATGSHVSGEGTIQAVDNGPKLVLHGSWRNVHWPLAADRSQPDLFASERGVYRLQGVWPYALTGEGDLAIPDLDPMTVAMRGALHNDHLRIDELLLGAFGGQAALAGEARWTPAESWALAGTVTGFDPATLRPGFPGALDFKLDASGKPFSTDGDLDVGIADLRGRLRGNAASGSGRFSLRGADWSFDKLRFAAGNTRLAIDGTLGATSNLDFSLDADNLALLAPDARGALRARGKLAGTEAAPVVKLTAQGSGIEAEGVKVEKLAANIDVDWRGQRTSHADIAISNLVYDERTLTQFNGTLDGTTASHRLRIDALAGRTSLHTRGDGAFADGQWNGLLDMLTINDTANINLTLDAPVKVVASANSFRIDPLCLLGATAKLCADGEWSEAGWRANASATNLPISTLTAGLTPKVEYQGTINASASARATGDAPFVGEARVDLVDAAIKHRRASGRQDVINFGSGLFTARAEPDDVVAELRLDAAALGGLIAGRMRAIRNSSDALAWPLRGQLNMSTSELGFITLYLPEIDRAAGHFDADVSFAGTLGRPSASGLVKLTKAELDFYQMNLALRQMDMQARIASNNLEFSANAKAGAGTLASAGTLEWREGLPYGDFKLQGENLRLVDVPEARIDASPDLDFKIAGREIGVSGEVKLPHARIAPADLTDAVLPSADERLVGETAREETDPFRVKSEITMTLGNDVTIETYGFSGQLTGSIKEITLPDEPSRARGDLTVVKGQYTAYARKLEIERGRLFYTGGLLVDPFVDIRAVKEYPEVKAGVNVRGSLREPRMTFFSEPSMPQSQVVSILLAGPTDAASGAAGGGQAGRNNELVGQAAAILASQLGSKLGIPDISVEQSADSDTTSLVLGKYLSPRLYVSYGISLTESINTIKMRYTLDDHWTIRTEAGKERSGDLVFTIEK